MEGVDFQVMIMKHSNCIKPHTDIRATLFCLSSNKYHDLYKELVYVLSYIKLPCLVAQVFKPVSENTVGFITRVGQRPRNSR